MDEKNNFSQLDPIHTSADTNENSNQQENQVQMQSEYSPIEESSKSQENSSSQVLPDDQGFPRKQSLRYKVMLIAGLAILSLVCAVIGSLVTYALMPHPSKGNFTPIINQPIKKTAFPVEQIAENVGPAVVVVENYRSGNMFFQNTNLQLAGTGSGFIIDSVNGYIVTNNHVIQGAEKIVVGLEDGRNIEAKLVGADPPTDLAVLKIDDTTNLIAASLGDSTKLAVGEPVVAIGNPGGNRFARSVTTGVVSAINRTLPMNNGPATDLIQTDAAINPGNSGGPLVNYQGLVIGINTVKYADYGFEGMGFAIPISSAIPTIEQLIKYGKAKHPALLVTVNDQYNAYAQYNNLPQGAYIQEVVPDGPAAKAGLKKGDVIIKVNDKTVKNSGDLIRELYRYQVGDQVTVTYLRENKTAEVQVTLGELTTQD